MFPETAPKLSRTPGVSTVNKPCADIGEHNYEILKSLGYSLNEIDELLQNNTIFNEPKYRL